MLHVLFVEVLYLNDSDWHHGPQKQPGLKQEIIHVPSFILGKKTAQNESTTQQHSFEWSHCGFHSLST